MDKKSKTTAEQKMIGTHKHPFMWICDDILNGQERKWLGSLCCWSNSPSPHGCFLWHRVAHVGRDPLAAPWRHNTSLARIGPQNCVVLQQCCYWYCPLKGYDSGSRNMSQLCNVNQKPSMGSGIRSKQRPRIFETRFGLLLLQRCAGQVAQLQAQNSPSNRTMHTKLIHCCSPVPSIHKDTPEEPTCSHCYQSFLTICGDLLSASAVEPSVSATSFTDLAVAFYSLWSTSSYTHRS